MKREHLSGASVLDLCTGSGFLAVTAALHGASRVVAVDVSRRAVASVKLNAWLNRTHVEALRGDLLEPVAARRFDVITSNPPYVPSNGRARNRATDAGPDGRAFIDRICDQAPDRLNPGGALLLIHSEVCGEQQTVEALQARGLQPSVVARHVGPPGPLMRERGLLAGPEEMLVIRGELPVDAAHEVRERHLLG
jgi:release factor glutamine methyltransferase